MWTSLKNTRQGMIRSAKSKNEDSYQRLMRWKFGPQMKFLSKHQYDETLVNIFKSSKRDHSVMRSIHCVCGFGF